MEDPGGDVFGKGVTLVWTGGALQEGTKRGGETREGFSGPNLSVRG